MKYDSYNCLICNRDYIQPKVHLLKLKFPPRPEPVIIVGTVDEEYSGIRVICKYCTEQLKSLEGMS